jgi:hypothetical protein
MNKVVSIQGNELQEVTVATLKEVEVDFGIPVVRNKTFTIVDADVTPSSLILANQSAKAATGKTQDENEAESILFKAVAGTGQFTLYAQVLNNSLVSGKFNVTYLIG